jgi:hypothetical protein
VEFVDGSISRYGVIHPLESASFAYSSPDRDPDGMMARQYSIPAGTDELNSAPGTPVHWLRNSSREDRTRFEPTTEFEQRKMFVAPLGKPEHAAGSEASSSYSQVGLVSHPVIDLPDNVSSPGPPVEVNISQASLDLERLQNLSIGEFSDEVLKEYAVRMEGIKLWNPIWFFSQGNLETCRHYVCGGVKGKESLVDMNESKHKTFGCSNIFLRHIWFFKESSKI